MVRHRLESKPSAGGSRPHVTCFFNAWLHDDAKNLGATFAGEVARDAHRRRPLINRIFKPLPWSLSSPDQRRMQLLVITTLVVVLTGVGVGLLSLWPLESGSTALERVASFLSGKNTPGVKVEATAGTVGATAGTVGLIFSLLLNAGKYFTSLGKAISAFVTNPERAASGGSLRRVRTQLGELIAQATPKGSRFVIFVDDLERCRPPRAVDLLEVVTQLLDHEGVVTVIVADIPAIASCADIKYKLLADRFDPADSITGARPEKRSVYGRLYLQKIVQLQFDIPAHRPDRLRALVESLARVSLAPSQKANPWWSRIVERMHRAARVGRDWNRQAVFAVGSQVDRLWPITLVAIALTAVLIWGDRVSHIPLVVTNGMFAGLRWLLARVVRESLGPWNGAGEWLASGLRPTLVAGLTMWLMWLTLRFVRTTREERMAAARRAIDERLAAGQSDATLKAALADVLPEDKIAALIAERRLLRLMNDSELLREAYDEVFLYLPQLPRNAKRALNRLRLLLFVAYVRGSLGGEPELSARHVGKWVALQERWPELGQALLRRPDGMDRLEDSVDDPERFGKELDNLLPGSDRDETLVAFCKGPQTRLKGRTERLLRFDSANEPRGATVGGTG